MRKLEKDKNEKVELQIKKKIKRQTKLLICCLSKKKPVVYEKNIKRKNYVKEREKKRNR